MRSWIGFHGSPDTGDRKDQFRITHVVALEATEGVKPLSFLIRPIIITRIM